MKIVFDAKRLYNNFTGLGNYSRTTIDILTEYVPQHQYFLYTPKVTKNQVTLPYLQSAKCRTCLPEGTMKGSLWRSYGLADDLARDEIDLFHGLSNEIPTGLAKRGCRLPGCSVRPPSVRFPGSRLRNRHGRAFRIRSSR